MYLLSQIASYLFLTFLLGVGVGYALWRVWGEREVVAKFNAAEMRLAAHLARLERSTFGDGGHHGGFGEGDANPEAMRAALEKQWEETAKRELHEFEVKHAALMKEAEDASIRKVEAAAEQKLSDLAKMLGYEIKAPGDGEAGQRPQQGGGSTGSIDLREITGAAAAVGGNSAGAASGATSLPHADPLGVVVPGPMRMKSEKAGA